MDPIQSIGATQGMQARSSAASGDADPARLRETAQQMEGVFLGILMKAMRSTVSSGGLFGESGAGQTYREMFDQEIANAMAKAGGIGLADIVVRDQLLRASREAGRESVRGIGSPDAGPQESSIAPVRKASSAEKEASVFDAGDRYPD